MDNFNLFGNYTGWKLHLPVLFSGFLILLIALSIFRPKSKFLTAIKENPLWVILAVTCTFSIMICWACECKLITYVKLVTVTVLIVCFPVIIYKIIRLLVRPKAIKYLGSGDSSGGIDIQQQFNENRSEIIINLNMNTKSELPKETIAIIAFLSPVAWTILSNWGHVPWLRLLTGYIVALAIIAGISLFMIYTPLGQKLDGGKLKAEFGASIKKKRVNKNQDP